ncbi:MAG: SIMPL domain-containing protein [Acidobacteriota bacterium]
MSVVIRQERAPLMQRPFVAALIVAVGLAAAGFFVAAGLVRAGDGGRFVEVSGSAEREVTADSAVWPLRFSASSEELTVAQAQLARATQAVMDFLARHNIEAAQTELQNLQVNDANATRAQPRVGPRFIVSHTVMVRSDRPLVLQAASQDLGELLGAGVVLASPGDAAPAGPTFLFRKLSILKPLMMAEATGNARKAADQFARDSGARIGGIRQATQGDFVVLPRDQIPGVSEAMQVQKVVRVTTTVQYFVN